MRSFRDAIDIHAAARSDAPLLLAPEPDSVIGYGELQRSARSLGAYLAGQGVAPGSVVSFMLPNGVSAASVFLGAMYAGYVVSPINLIAQDAQIAYVLGHSGARFISQRRSSSPAWKNFAAKRSAQRCSIQPTPTTLICRARMPAISLQSMPRRRQCSCTPRAPPATRKAFFSRTGI